MAGPLRTRVGDIQARLGRLEERARKKPENAPKAFTDGLPKKKTAKMKPTTKAAKPGLSGAAPVG